MLIRMPDLGLNTIVWFAKSNSNNLLLFCDVSPWIVMGINRLARYSAWVIRFLVLSVKFFFPPNTISWSGNRFRIPRPCCTAHCNNQLPNSGNLRRKSARTSISLVDFGKLKSRSHSRRIDALYVRYCIIIIFGFEFDWLHITFDSSIYFFH